LGVAQGWIFHRGACEKNKTSDGCLIDLRWSFDHVLPGLLLPDPAFAQLDWAFQSLPEAVPDCGRQRTAVFFTTWVVVLARREKPGWIVAFCCSRSTGSC